MDFLFENWPVIFSGLIAILTAFKLVKVLPYVNFAKEVGDVYIKYQEIEKDGKRTDDEKISFADEIFEAIDGGKEAFKGQPKK